MLENDQDTLSTEEQWQENENYEENQEEGVSSEQTDLEKKIQELQEQLDQEKQNYLLKMAELDNWRKRLFQENKDQLEKNKEQILLDVIGLLDNFDRALTMSQANEDFQTLYKGIEISELEFLSTLKNKYCLQDFGREGEIFDPHKHEALEIIAEEQDGQEIISKVLQKGYALNDQVIRHARVNVIKK